MGQILQLSVLLLSIQASQAVWQHITVMKGQTFSFNCPIKIGRQNIVEWQNPEGFILFFSHTKGLKDKRYSLIKLSRTEFTIQISNVSFKDGGIYTCYEDGQPQTDKRVELTVLGQPKMQVAKHEGRSEIKCTADGNHSPPQISWMFDHGPEFHSHAYLVTLENKKYISVAKISVLPVKNRVTVKCLVRHPALHSHTLMNTIKVGRDLMKPRQKTTTMSPQSSTEFRRGRTTVSTTDMDVPKTVSSTGSHLSTSNESKTSSSSGSTRMNDSSTNTTGWIPVYETTEIPPSNHTRGNRTVGINDPNTQTGSAQRSPLLVFLVSLLIFCLLVVLIFFGIKLRRAHVLWRRENEESDPSEESSKSKTSQEDKSVQGQRRRGLFNTAFTQYVLEKPAAITSVINTAAMEESLKEEQTSQPQTQEHAPAKCDIKETEL